MELGQAIRFSIIVLPIIEEWEGWIHSWYRCHERNDDLPGSHPDSRHLDGTAIDAGFYREEERDIAYDQCYEMGLHGQKKEWIDPITGRLVHGFHMQLEAPRGS